MFAAAVYGRFLSIINAKATIPTIITTMIAATPNITVLVEANPLSGDAVGAAVAAGKLAQNPMEADDPQYACVPAKVA